MKKLDLRPLVAWFKLEKRDLPWREEKTPYRVWVSEVMLQQTTAKAVIPYFIRWMEKFPTVDALASASYEVVIKAWEGLGYYSRVRNLWEGAKICQDKFGGQVPDTEEGLCQLKGVGPYTQGAILSFAFGKRAAAVDGNVLRVMSRLTLYEGEIEKGRKEIEKRVLEALPEDAPSAMEALIELGATLCGKTPKCLLCPLKGQCLALMKGKERELPLKKKMMAVTRIERSVVVVKADGKVLVKRGEAGKIMAGLYEFPYFEGKDSFNKVQEWGLETYEPKAEKVQTHSFTRYHATLYPYSLKGRYKEIEGCEWVEEEKLADLPFSSGHRKIYLDLFIS
jgi:A/G-specific adenine glycosylase